MKRTYPVVVERGPTLYGAHAPEVPSTFVVARTLPEARRRVRVAIARVLRWTEEMADDMPEPDPKVARALARVTDPGSGLPVDPAFEIVTVEVGPEDAPPEAPPEPDPTLPEAGRSEPWNETFVAVIGKTPQNYCGEAPDLPVCVSVGDTMEEMRRNLAEVISMHVQSLVDDGAPLPERRLTPEEALRRSCEDRDNDPWDPGDPEDASVAERITVEIRPPRPQARVLNAMWRQASENEKDFEKDCLVWSAVGPGESWKGAYAARAFEAAGVWYGNIPDLPLLTEEGATLDELRANLRATIEERLRDAVASEGALPLPRRTAETAQARESLFWAGEGDEDFPGENHFIEMIPVEIVAPAVAAAS